MTTQRLRWTWNKSFLVHLAGGMRTAKAKLLQRCSSYFRYSLVLWVVFSFIDVRILVNPLFMYILLLVLKISFGHFTIIFYRIDFLFNVTTSKTSLVLQHIISLNQISLGFFRSLLMIGFFVNVCILLVLYQRVLSYFYNVHIFLFVYFKWNFFY